MDGLCFDGVDRRKLQQLWQTTDDASLCRRVQAILAVDEGSPVASIARWHGVSRQTIYAWIERFQSESDTLALQDQKQTGRPRGWTEATQAALQDCLRWPLGKWGYQAVSWTVLLLQNWLAEYVGRTFSETTIRTHLHAMGYSWKRSRYVLQPDPDRDKKDEFAAKFSVFPSEPWYCLWMRLHLHGHICVVFAHSTSSALHTQHESAPLLLKSKGNTHRLGVSRFAPATSNPANTGRRTTRRNHKRYAACK